MELKKLTESDIAGLKGRPVYLVRFSQEYLDELYVAYPDLPILAGVIDTTPARIGRKEFRGRRLAIYGMDSLAELPEGAALVITTGYHREEYRMLQEALPPRMSGDTVYYFANRDTEYYEHYLERYRDAPLEDIIVFRSGPHAGSYVEGLDYADNARALFEYMLEEGYSRRYELVWLVKDPSRFRRIERQYPNVHFLSFDWSVSEEEGEREAYYRVLCLAKYLFMTDAYGFCRNAREGQVRVQLWHGCGFKTRTNFDRCEHRYEYNIVTSPAYRKIHQRMFGLREDQVLVTGYPKGDQIFRPAEGWRERLGIPEAGRYVFWLPTFRTPVRQLAQLTEKAPEGHTGLPVIREKGELQELDRFLRGRDICLVVKPHPIQDTGAMELEGLSNIVFLPHARLVRADIQVNRILGHADALISDYSSAAVDFLLLDRPVAFTLDDAEEYGKSRGFHFRPLRDWLPGCEVMSYAGLVRFIGDVADGKDTSGEKRRRLMGTFHQFRDGQSCRRVLEALGIGEKI